MKENKEISALLNLLDDPDEEVFSTVSERIISLGKEIIPNLENLWENIHDEETQERIESLIHRLHFRDLQEDFINWKNENGTLIDGALLISKYQYPELNTSKILAEIEKMRRNIWLELNNYLTPIEQINVMNSIFYNYYKIKGVEISYDNPGSFLLSKVLESKKGNALGNGILYLTLCEQLDIPVRAIKIPKQFIIAYFDIQYEAMNPIKHASEKIKFYIDAVSGQMYSNKDIENYFKQLAVPPISSYFKPCDNKGIIKFLLEEFSKCFDDPKNQYKKEELLFLASLLEDEEN